MSPQFVSTGPEAGVEGAPEGGEVLLVLAEEQNAGHGEGDEHAEEDDEEVEDVLKFPVSANGSRS